jgi:hypothetical protein
MTQEQAGASKLEALAHEIAHLWCDAETTVGHPDDLAKLIIDKFKWAALREPGEGAQAETDVQRAYARGVSDEREANAETLERWQNAYFQDQGITPEGELRPLVSKLVERADRAQQQGAQGLRELLEEALDFLSGIDSAEPNDLIRKCRAALAQPQGVQAGPKEVSDVER